MNDDMTVSRSDLEKICDAMEDERLFTQRLRAWQAFIPRQSALLAFTAGELRQAAWCIEEERQAERARCCQVILHHVTGRGPLRQQLVEAIYQEGA